ncbi:MAG: hypothetical protein IJZ25_01785 [Lachnospiraceae bacterium]|nr:hypothetical protein [Lachnospiraceae bacterium]
MIKHRCRKYMAGLLAVLFVMIFALSGMAAADSATVTGNVTIDGDISDWSGVTGASVDQASLDTACVSQWKIAYSPDGSKVYISYEGTTPGSYYTDFLERNLLITQNGQTTSIRVGNLPYYGSNFEMQYVNNAVSYTTPGAYSVEIAIDASYFTDENFTIALEGVTTASAEISSSDIPVLDGQDVSTEPETTPETTPGEENPEVTPGEDEPVVTPEAVYEGIVIDGSFSDWDGVAKHAASCPNESHTGCLDQMAAVFDGDYVYIYINEGVGGSAAGAGKFSNGMYSIYTDLGRNMVFQINPDGTVSGVDGALCEKYGDQWEVAIPADQLPQYLESISVGLYQGEMFVTDLVNLQGDGGNVGSFDGIVYDGLFADWDAYPHTLIEYATAGTQEIIADGEGALYSDGSILYGHVVSPMIAHITQGGGEMTRNITIRFNEDDNAVFYPRLVAVDENGNINWNPKLSELEPGKYEFYLASLDAWGTSTNISDLNPMDTLYGKMSLTVRGDSLADEVEFYLDLELIAEKLGMDADEFKTIQGMFGEIGHDWITTAGASSGAWAGIALSLGVVGAVLLRKKKNGEM